MTQWIQIFRVWWISYLSIACHSIMILCLWNNLFILKCYRFYLVFGNVPHREQKSSSNGNFWGVSVDYDSLRLRSVWLPPAHTYHHQHYYLCWRSISSSFFKKLWRNNFIMLIILSRASKILTQQYFDVSTNLYASLSFCSCHQVIPISPWSNPTNYIFLERGGSCGCTWYDFVLI